MSKDKEIEWITKEIQNTLQKLENTFWEFFVGPSYGLDESPIDHLSYREIEKIEKETWLYHGTKMLYHKICLFLELKNLPLYYHEFVSKFKDIIEVEKDVLKSYPGLYNDSEPAMVIHDKFREFLSAFVEFDYEEIRKMKTNKLRLILDNTNSIIAKTKTNVTNETSIYRPIKWLIELIYPDTRPLGKARFIKKDWTYHPDILVPETSSAVEYKLVRSGEKYGKYLDQIKTDADNYEGDPEYKYFYAVLYFEIKSEINQAAFTKAIREKNFPDNWTIIAL